MATLPKFWVIGGFESADGATGVDTDTHGPFETLADANEHARRLGWDFYADEPPAEITGRRAAGPGDEKAPG